MVALRIQGACESNLYIFQLYPLGIVINCTIEKLPCFLQDVATVQDSGILKPPIHEEFLVRSYGDSNSGIPQALSLFF